MPSLLSRCQFQQVFPAPGITVELPMTGHGEMDSSRTSSTISGKFYGTGATKTASESEPKSLILCPFLPRNELKNRGHIRLHAGATRRALR